MSLIFEKRHNKSKSITPSRELAKRVLRDGKMTEKEFEEVFRQAVKFMVIKSLDPHASYFLPSKRVEKVLLHFSQDPSEYRYACYAICGYYISPLPPVELVLGRQRYKTEAYAFTREIMRKYYGKLDESIWPENERDFCKRNLKIILKALDKMPAEFALPS